MKADKNAISDFLFFQEDEITSSIVYAKLAHIVKDSENKKTLLQIAAEEKAHYEILKRHTGKEVAPNRWRIFKYYWLARILGLTFAIKLMEKEERDAQEVYARYPEYPELEKLGRDEEVHEQKLIGLINEEKLEYMGSVVLGLNDALVEFTGALAGFTLALSNAPLIALTGSITGIAAALSMASSEYLSTKSEEGDSKHPVKAAVYTGIAYIITVVALVAPFIFIENVLVALGLMLVMALTIIALFNYYYAVARGESFKKRFLEMAILSFTVAGISFLIGYALKTLTGIDAA
ncbi:VIT1/CCC1 transporter family protein [Bacteroides graminisolvens]|jgi:VIT1/CCC1 family predicted Fe2+/Mn2+ transporter|uniref:Nodulin 21-related protein n=1 Tax=Bacteroides graminisolvens DSM 19988 = JCM 15093 TaxID=1121097 RepID=A0A069D5W3_9BACE|nr:VIT1/CCC1 transporter family protein [Bacteroides graminisolvens]GAK37730.1 nodulin 21-related protein [Bacteroides graminisolvens DSM 19988 = JCM 15093]